MGGGGARELGAVDYAGGGTLVGRVAGEEIESEEGYGEGNPVEVVDYTRAEECRTVFKGRLVDDYGGTLGLNALHDALD